MKWHECPNISVFCPSSLIVTRSEGVQRRRWRVGRPIPWSHGTWRRSAIMTEWRDGKVFRRIPGRASSAGLIPWDAVENPLALACRSDAVVSGRHGGGGRQVSKGASVCI